jgi:hypothetical protein
VRALATIAKAGKVSPVGLHLPDDLSFRDWRAIGSALKQAEGSILWWIGDWLRFGERKWRETYREVIEATGYSRATAYQCKWVAEAFDFSRRLETLSWSHHLAVASLASDDADRLLIQAEQTGWSEKELRRRAAQLRSGQVRRLKGQQGKLRGFEALRKLVQAGRKFRTIYADPPWLYQTVSEQRHPCCRSESLRGADR